MLSVGVQIKMADKLNFICIGLSQISGVHSSLYFTNFDYTIRVSILCIKSLLRVLGSRMDYNPVCVYRGSNTIYLIRKIRTK